MSFTRNPRKFDVKTNGNNGVNYGEISKHRNEIKRLLNDSDYSGRQLKDKIQEEVDMIVYLLNHEKVNNFKPTTINNLVRSVENKLDGVAGIKIDELSEFKQGTLTVG